MSWFQYRTPCNPVALDGLLENMTFTENLYNRMHKVPIEFFIPVRSER